MLKSCSSEKNIRDSLRIVELKGKKDSSTKISICSNKQASKQNERGSDDKQTTKKGLGRISINLFNPTSRTVKPIITVETGREDKHKLKEKSARETAISSLIDQNGSRANNTMSEAQKKVIESIRAQFQQRTKTIILQNAKTIQQLRSSLCQLQQKIAQKEQIINNLMSMKHMKRLNTEETTSRSNSHEQSIFYSTKPAVDHANIELLWSKTYYLQTNLRAIIERFAENDSVKEKLSRIQKGFFSHLSQRVSRCWVSLQQYCINIDRKCHQIEAAIQNFIRNAPIMTQCKENTEKFKEKFNDLTLQFRSIQQDIASFKENVLAFQNNVDSGLPAQDNPYFDDDDQFFYPATSRRTPSEASLVHL